MSLLVALVWVVVALGGSAACGADSDIGSVASSVGIPARVVKVTDGDSLRLQVDAEQDREAYRIEVRLAQIDAPEWKQPYGRQARMALAKLVENRNVRFEVLEIDHYGRSVSEVYVGGLHVNREMVRAGHAWAYARHARSIEVIELEDEARAAVRGLWKLPAEDRDAPWAWRHAQRRGSTAEPVEPESFECGTRRRCREMRSCAEARFHLETCGLPLDGDGDGVPCEQLCRD